MPGFRARLSFFVLGERDAHVVLAGNDVAAWDIPTKDVYEIRKLIFDEALFS